LANRRLEDAGDQCKDHEQDEEDGRNGTGAIAASGKYGQDADDD
jgi:hypothetical protein